MGHAQTADLINTEAGGRTWHDRTEGEWTLGVVFGHLRSFRLRAGSEFSQALLLHPSQSVSLACKMCMNIDLD